MYFSVIDLCEWWLISIHFVYRPSPSLIMTCPSQSLWATTTAWSTATRERPWAPQHAAAGPPLPPQEQHVPWSDPPAPERRQHRYCPAPGSPLCQGLLVWFQIMFISTLIDIIREDHQQLHRGYENTPRMYSNIITGAQIFSGAGPGL